MFCDKRVVGFEDLAEKNLHSNFDVKSMYRKILVDGLRDDFGQECVGFIRKGERKLRRK